MNDRTGLAGPGGVLCSRSGTLSTGILALDQLLAGGWPLGAITELTYAAEGSGELKLLLPALRSMTRAQLWAAWVGAPHVPYAPALKQAGVQLPRVLVVEAAPPREQAWAVERCLRSPECGVTLFWRGVGRMPAWRRLQRAAECGGGMGVWLHPGARDPECVPALRLRVERTRSGTAVVHILKRRQGWPAGPIPISFDDGALQCG